MLLQHEDLSGISPEHHALVIPPFMGSGGKRVHPLPYIESNLPGILKVCVLHTFSFLPPLVSTEYNLHQSSSATKADGSKQRPSIIRLWQCCMEGENG